MRSRQCQQKRKTSQSLHARLGVDTTNGDGFNLGWYGAYADEISEESRIIVSEPLGDLPGVWNEVPESTYGIIQEGDDEMRPFRPVKP